MAVGARRVPHPQSARDRRAGRRAKAASATRWSSSSTCCRPSPSSAAPTVHHTHFGRSLTRVLADPTLEHRDCASSEGGFRPTDEDLFERGGLDLRSQDRPPTRSARARGHGDRAPHAGVHLRVPRLRGRRALRPRCRSRGDHEPRVATGARAGRRRLPRPRARLARRDERRDPVDPRPALPRPGPRIPRVDEHDRRSRRRGAARQPEPAHARELRRDRVRHAEPRSLRSTLGAVHSPLHRLAAVHARSPRHLVWRARFSLEAVGIDRGVGAVDHGAAATRRRGDDARVRPSAPLRDRRRELPHRLHCVGLRAWSRGRSLAHVPRPHGLRRADAARAPEPRSRTSLRHLAHLLPR